MVQWISSVIWSVKDVKVTWAMGISSAKPWGRSLCRDGVRAQGWSSAGGRSSRVSESTGASLLLLGWVRGRKGRLGRSRHWRGQRDSLPSLGVEPVPNRRARHCTLVCPKALGSYLQRDLQGGSTCRTSSHVDKASHCCSLINYFQWV